MRGTCNLPSGRKFLLVRAQQEYVDLDRGCGECNGDESPNNQRGLFDKVDGDFFIQFVSQRKDKISSIMDLANAVQSNAILFVGNDAKQLETLSLNECLQELILSNLPDDIAHESASSIDLANSRAPHVLKFIKNLGKLSDHGVTFISQENRNIALRSKFDNEMDRNY